MKKLLLLILVITIGVAWYYLKSDNSTYEEISTVFITSAEVLPSDVVVKIGKNSFEPTKIVIKKGDRVAFVNESDVYAWPASDPHPTHTNFPKFDPELPMKPLEAWTYVFEEVGSFEYHDHLDPSKRGIINVTM